MDKHTFGDSGAPVNIISVLDQSENTEFSKRARRILSKYLVTMKALKHIPDKNTRETSYKMWRSHYIEGIEASSFPLIVETHLKCCIVGWYRKWMKESPKQFVTK